MKFLCLQSSSIFENYGGIEYYLHDTLTLLAETLGKGSITTLVPQRGDRFELTPCDYEVEAVPFTSSGFLKKIENRFSRSFFKKAISLAKENSVDCILVGHVSLAPLAYALSKILNIPYWTFAYGVEVWGGLSLPTDWAFRRSQKIISISHWTKEILISRGISNDRISVVHPGLSPFFEKASPKDFNQPSESPLKLLTVSRLDPQEQYKGHDHVISALGLIKKKSPEWLPHYTIQGKGEDRKRLEQMVFLGGLSEHVTFLDGLTSREDLADLYRQADAFIMPSRFGCWEGRWRGEGFGIVYVEAAALGVPSIAYECGGVVDIIQTGINGILVKPDDITALSHTLISISKNRQLLVALGKQAREIALQKFSQRAIAREIQNTLGLGKSILEVSPGTDSIDVSQLMDPIS